MSDNHYHDAIDRLEGYLRADPRNLSLLEAAFDEALRCGQPDRARRHLEVALQVESAPSLGWQHRQAHVLMALHDWAGALKCLERLAARNEESTEDANIAIAIAGDRAYVLMCLGETDRGIEVLRPVVTRAGARQPLPKPLDQTWLRLLHRADHLDEALAWTQSRIEAGAIEPAAVGVASLAALDAGDYDRCRSWAGHALKHLPRPPIEALVAAASLCLGDQNAESAVALAQRALEMNANDGRARSALAFAFMLAGDLARAQCEFETAVKYLPDHVGTWHGLAWVHVVAGDLQAAKQAFLKAIDLDPNFAESHGGLATVEALRNDAAAASAALKRARRLDPDCVSAQYAQAVLSGEAGSPEAVRALGAAALRHAKSRRSR